MSETDPHDGDSCAEVERRLDDAVGDLNSIGMLLARFGCSPRQADGSWDYEAAIVKLGRGPATEANPVDHCPVDCDGPECNCWPRVGGACTVHAWEHAVGHLRASAS